MPDLSGNSIGATLPSGGDFTGVYLNLSASLSQYVNISSALKPYLNTVDYTIMACVNPQNPGTWRRLWDFVSAACIVWSFSNQSGVTSLPLLSPASLPSVFLVRTMEVRPKMLAQDPSNKALRHLLTHLSSTFYMHAPVQ